MSKARDLFCFCAFTSLRYSDVVEVRRVDIQNGVLNITNQQMNRALKELGEICSFTTPYTITCYRNCTRYDEVYPKYELIGTHTDRKTFICFALSNGVPPDVVMKFTGHCDYKSMKPYIDITESAKRDAISLMEKAFDAK